MCKRECAQVCKCATTHAWRSGDSFHLLSQLIHSPPYFGGQCRSLNLELTNWPDWLASESPRVCQCLLPHWSYTFIASSPGFFPAL